MEVVLEKDPGKTVLLFSGGLDSYLAYRLFHPDILLYVACNHLYQGRELRAIRDLGLVQKVELSSGELGLSKWERKTDSIIPLRNLLFACVASRYGSRIWIGSIADEVNHDKTPDFYKAISETMTVCYRPSYWCEGRTIVVESPVANWTKAELIRMARQEGISPEEWQYTVSCYEANGYCGRCKSCFKRWVAHKVNGLWERYDTDPSATAVADEELRKAREGIYGVRRATEILAAFGEAEWSPEV